MVKGKQWFFLTAVWHGMQFICGSEYRYPIRRVSITEPFRGSILFLTSYFIVSKWWEERSCYFQVFTLPFLLSYKSVTYYITWPGSERLQIGRRLIVKKKIVENLV